MKEIEITSNGVKLIAGICGATQHFLLLHAGGENRRVWLPVQERLAKAGFGTAALDLRGHGRSQGSVNDPIECFGHDIKRLQEFCAGPRILVGASLGGLASVLALADQDLQSSFDGLVLVDVVPTPDPDHTRRFLRATAPLLAKISLVDDIIRKRHLFSQAASRIAIPVLLVRAGQTGPMSDDDVSSFRELCPQLVVECVESAGHLIARDAPQALADILLRFWQYAAARNNMLLCGNAGDTNRTNQNFSLWHESG